MENIPKADPLLWLREVGVLMREAAQAQDWDKLRVIDGELRQRLTHSITNQAPQEPEEVARTVTVLQELVAIYEELLTLGERERRVLGEQLQTLLQKQKAQQAYQEKT